MVRHEYLKELSLKIQDLYETAKELYDNSADFPAVNRNLKRVLASVEMLRINIESVSD